MTPSCIHPVPPDDQPHDGRIPNAVDTLRHELRSPLTTISGRAQLLARAVRRSPSLALVEQERMLIGLAAIEAAVQRLVTVIDGIVPRDGA
jgi:signal transduction histidine kinase